MEPERAAHALCIKITLDNSSSRSIGMLEILFQYWFIGNIIIYELNNLRQLTSVCFLYMHLSVYTKCGIYTWYCFVKSSSPGDWECPTCAHEKFAVSKGVRVHTSQHGGLFCHAFSARHSLHCAFLSLHITLDTSRVTA